MYAIRVNSDNSISTIINQNIAQGYKLSDWFWIFSDQYYKDKDMTNCEAMIEFIKYVKNTRDFSHGMN